MNLHGPIICLYDYLSQSDLSYHNLSSITQYPEYCCYYIVKMFGQQGEVDPLILKNMFKSITHEDLIDPHLLGPLTSFYALKDFAQKVSVKVEGREVILLSVKEYNQGPAKVRNLEEYRESFGKIGQRVENPRFTNIKNSFLKRIFSDWS